MVVPDQSNLLQVSTWVENSVVTARVNSTVALIAEASSRRSSQLLNYVEIHLGLAGQVPRADIISCVVLASALGIFIIASFPDFHRFFMLTMDEDQTAAPKETKASAEPRAEEPSTGAQESKAVPGEEARHESERPQSEMPQSEQPGEEDSPKPASMATILGLTFYRFYTGFLSATWLPYLLAMEGAELWRDNQALFMGIAKLIYGLSILMTPIFGLLGDRLACVSHALGRRLFVRIGIIVAAIGIFLCHWSAQTAPRRPGHFSIFMAGILIWRLGEGLNDVTTEAICPEMLPSEQYEISSAIRASMFLVGGLGGYVMVMLLVTWPYYWLYQGYLIMMFLCGIPPLLVISRDIPKSNTRGASRTGQSFISSIIEAYVKPSQYEGGFPCACFCIFLFSCGSAPMFFLLLMLRDLVGINEQVRLQRHFSLISIDFFLSAAVAAVLNALVSPKKPPTTRVTESADIRVTSFRLTAFATLSFGVVCVLMPFVHFFPHEGDRAKAFYVLASGLGATFGSVYARFQDCTWQLLPPKIEFANAMGFSTMWKLLGAGLGNFIAGLVLDLFQSDKPLPLDIVNTRQTNLVGYKIGGYMAVCWGSAVLAFITGFLVLTIPGKALQAREMTGSQAREKTTGA